MIFAPPALFRPVMTTTTSAAICSPSLAAAWCGWRCWKAGQLFHSEVIAANEDVLQQVVLLAAFIPLLGGTGGNVGAQSSTVVIRGLSTEISSLGLRAIGREAMAGALLGVLMMLLVVPFAGGAAKAHW